MLKVGLTGGIGTGKTLVSKIFQLLDIPVFNADQEAKTLMQTDAGLVRQLKHTFGEDIYDPQGKLRRKALADKVFTDPKALEALNALVHPAVGSAFGRFVSGHVHKVYVIKEAALIYESGSYRQLDMVISVSSPLELRIRRIMDRDNTDRSSVEDRMKNQWPEEKKLALADFVIENNEAVLLIPQVLEIHQKISAKIAGL